MNKYNVEVTLTILGPFITAAASVDSYGFNKTFRRNQRDEPVIPATHIKGKLRTAFNELTSVKNINFPHLDIDHWFGRKSDQDEVASSRNYEPYPSALYISDFWIEGASSLTSQPHSRTKIHKESRTASANSLRTFESLFASGSEIKARGTVTYYAEEANSASVADVLKVGFQWITSFGAEKGIGFGRLKKVTVSPPQLVSIPVSFKESTKNLRQLQLRIRPLEPILIGGIKKRRTNYVRSEAIMSGGLIKGALAGGLNRAYGRRISDSLTEAVSGTFPGFDELATNFSHIRISHGYPVYREQAHRPYRKPISLVVMDGREVDVALSSDEFPMHPSGIAPTYFLDWKGYVPYEGMALPRELFVTRTAVDEHSRRSRKGQLFTYAFVCPEDEVGKEIEWIADVDFSAVPEAARQQTVDQFIRAALQFLDRLGKLGRSVEVDVKEMTPIPLQPLIRDGFVLVTLQTPALMLNPEMVRLQAPGDTLHDLYADYWQAVSSQMLVMEDFFAHQTFEGGYLYHRYIGQHERDDFPNSYYPYYLTDAGSVFRLKAAAQEDAIKSLLAEWQTGGLPIPGWALSRYGENIDAEIWQTCPFVPTNGYGEIAVNLDCHWDKKL